MSHGIYDRCICGHRHPEHTIFGTCHGCLNCTDDVHDLAPPDDAIFVDGAPDVAHDDGSNAEDDHPYRQCDCRKFVLGERGEPSAPSVPPEDY